MRAVAAFDVGDAASEHQRATQRPGSRLLHEPTLRMKRAAGSDDAYLYVSALRELFGLDSETEPEAEGRANVTELRRRKSG